MCDYSLHAVQSRPAKIGEKLVSTSSGSHRPPVLLHRTIVRLQFVYCRVRNWLSTRKSGSITDGFGPRKLAFEWRAFVKSIHVFRIAIMMRSNFLTERWCW
jgi:hypothetical protein